MKHEDRPLFGRQAAEPAVELVPVADAEQLVGCSRTVSCLGIHRSGTRQAGMGR